MFDPLPLSAVTFGATLGDSWKLVRRGKHCSCMSLWSWKNKPVQPARVVSVIFCGRPAGLGGRLGWEADPGSLHLGAGADFLVRGAFCFV